MSGAMVKVKCACGCGQEFEARVADRARGWGKYLNKSHKAKAQEKRTHQHRYYLRRPQSDSFDSARTEGMDANEDGWDGHKNAF